MKRILYIFLSVLLLSACADDRSAKNLFERVESIMEDAPDSALAILDSAENGVGEYGKADRMRYQLLKAEAMNKSFVDFNTDSVMLEVARYYDHHGSSNEKMKAYYLLGCAYRDMGEAPMALQCYNDAVEKADTLSQDCDYTTLYKIYGQMDEIYESQVMPEEAIEVLKQYRKYALKAGNIYEYIHGLEYMTDAYSLLGDTAMILSTEQKVHDLYNEHGFQKSAASAYTTSMYVYIARGNYKKVRQLMLLYENESGLFDKYGDIQKGREGYYLCKGLYYIGVNQIDSADFYFKKLLDIKDKSFHAYRGLMHVSQERGDAAAVLSYSKLYEAAFDTLVSKIHADATRQALGMYDYGRHQRTALLEMQKSKERQHIIYSLLLLFTLAASLALYLYTRARVKKKLEISMLKQRLENLAERYNSTQDELALLETNHVALIEQKQKELAELQHQLQDIQVKYSHLLKLDNLERLKQSKPVVEIKQNLDARQYTRPLKEKQWRELTAEFRYDMPQLYSFISDGHNLGMLELRVTILTLLGFHSDEMALLLDVSKQSVSNARASANNKLFSDSSARTFFQNLSQI